MSILITQNSRRSYHNDLPFLVQSRPNPGIPPPVCKKGYLLISNHANFSNKGNSPCHALPCTVPRIWPFVACKSGWLEGLRRRRRVSGRTHGGSSETRAAREENIMSILK